jgi:hypothetical protein
MSDFDHMSINDRPRGPYGTNVGDIWSGEHSMAGQMLLEQEGLVMIHEIMDKDGKIQDCVYSVAIDNPDMEMQMAIRRAREGTKKWIAAQAASN